jgi:hypothetical protein
MGYMRSRAHGLARPVSVTPPGTLRNRLHPRAVDRHRRPGRADSSGAPACHAARGQWLYSASSNAPGGTYAATALSKDCELQRHEVHYFFESGRWETVNRISGQVTMQEAA